MTEQPGDRAERDGEDAPSLVHGDERDAGRTWALRNGAHLLALWGFAAVQPTLNLLEEHVEFFSALRRIDGWGAVVVLVLFAVVPPLVVLGVEALAGLLSARLRDRLHLVAIWALIALVGEYALKTALTNAGISAVVGGLLTGVAGAFLYVRARPVRSFLTVLAPAPVIFLLLFLFISPAKVLLFPPDAPAADVGPSDVPVVMVVFDELPISSLMDEREDLDGRRFPSFSALAGDATWFRNTTTDADTTVHAVPALLTGRRPVRDALPTSADHPENLFTLLGRSHRLNVDEHETALCPTELCPPETPLARRMLSLGSALTVAWAQAQRPGGLGITLPAVGSTWEGAIPALDPRHQIDVADAEDYELTRYGDGQFARFLDSIHPDEAGDRPSLHFLHSVLPHEPWRYLPSGKVYASHFEQLPGLIRNRGQWSEDQTLVDQGFQRHLLQVEYTDRLLGDLIQRLRDTGLYDQSLVVVTADHGVSFSPGGKRRSTELTNVGDIGLVPLFIKAPGQTRGRVIERSVQLIDLLPTMAALLDLPVPWQIDGESAFDLPNDGRRQVQILRNRGGNPVLDVEELQRSRAETVARAHQLFGFEDGSEDLWGFGAYRGLVGKRVEGMNAEAAVDGPTIELDDVEDFSSVDLGSRFIPARVTGKVSGAGAREVNDVAVAVNGRIAGVAPAYLGDGEMLFSVMVDEQDFRAGPNDVDVFSIASLNGEARLERLGGT